MKPLFVHPNCEEWFLLWIQNYDFVASGVETSACRVLFLHRTLLWQSHFFFSQFFFLWSKSLSQIQVWISRKQKSSCFICRQNSWGLKWCYFLCILYCVFLLLYPPPPPSPLTPCWLQEFSDPGANWICFCLSDLTQLIRNMPGYNNYIQACS